MFLIFDREWESLADSSAIEVDDIVCLLLADVDIADRGFDSFR